MVVKLTPLQYRIIKAGLAELSVVDAPWSPAFMWALIDNEDRLAGKGRLLFVR